MKRIFFSSLILIAFAANAQETDEIKPAQKGVVYGETIAANGEAISITALESKMANNPFEGKITGKVKEVCKSMGLDNFGKEGWVCFESKI
ncbi:MAG: hypothetical protein ABR502_11675 [Chitinophagaceae bacterium]